MSVLSVGTAAWLIDRASQFHNISTWISYLLPQQDARIRGLLERLGKRIDILQQPLHFCLLWSHDKGSCVADVVFQARDLIVRVERFIKNCALKQKAKEKMLPPDQMLLHLDGYLKELDYTVNSVNLAVSLIVASQNLRCATPTVGDDHKVPQYNSDSITGQRRGPLSSSSLLRSSRRLTEMHNSGGDVCVCFGSLYRRTAPSLRAGGDSDQDHTAHPEPVEVKLVDPAAAAAAAAAAGTSPPDNSWERVDAEDQTLSFPVSASAEPIGVGQWSEVWPGSVSTYKVYRDRLQRKYTLLLESTDAFALSPGGADVEHSKKNNKQEVTGLGAAGDATASVLEFALEPSLSFKSSTTAGLGLIPVTDAASRHGSGSGGGRQSNRRALSQKADLEDYTLTWVTRLSNQITAQYAFVLHPQGHRQETQSGLRPIDVTYVTKLCVFENIHAQGIPGAERDATVVHGRVQDKDVSPAHVEASDEELWLLLGGPATPPNAMADLIELT